MNQQINLEVSSYNSFSQAKLEECIHKYLDAREDVLWDDIELDQEVFKEVSALYRVIKYLTAEDGVKPMPAIVKRMFYLKREIEQTHRARKQRKTWSSRAYVR